MKKSEAEAIFPELCRTWREENKLPYPEGEVHYSFSDFKTWLSAKGYSHYLRFRSLAGAAADAARWFDDLMKQAWRN